MVLDKLVINSAPLGGWLGSHQRRRTRQAAISSEYPHAGFDPEISEWDILPYNIWNSHYAKYNGAR